MLSNKKMMTDKKMITKTSSPARVAGTKRNIDELCDAFTGVKIKKAKTKPKKKRLDVRLLPALPSVPDDDLSLELSSMSMSSSSSSSSSPPPPQKTLLDLPDDNLRLIASFLHSDDRCTLALTCHDFARTRN